MTHKLKCISPIDGSVFAERDTLSFDAALGLAQAARTAQTGWAARPLQDRINLVMAGVAAVGAMNDEIVPELAQMMDCSLEVIYQSLSRLRRRLGKCIKLEMDTPEGEVSA